MSDHFISIVPEKAIVFEPKKLGEKLVSWLFHKKIISNICTDCTLGGPGYAPAENFESILCERDGQLLGLRTNGLEVITERHVFHSGGNDVEKIFCNNCNANLVEEDWQTAVGAWFEASDDENIVCPECQNKCSITSCEFIPPWGFSNFGLIFWNWNALNDEFIQELEEMVGSKVRIIKGRI